VQPVDGVGQLFSRRPRLPACLAGDLAGNHGHERALIGADFFNERDQIRPRITFDVELDARRLCAQEGGDLADVGGRDVPLVGSRMDRDARRAGIDAYLHGFENARDASAARIAQRRDLVHVDR
jgi:hypothetical protein